jgi:virginiamycin B lyase
MRQVGLARGSGAWLAAPALAIVAAVGGCGGGSGDTPPERRPAPPGSPSAGERPASGGGASSLVDRLRRGGHVLALRHTATDFSMTDSGDDFRDCSRQRSLNAEGRRQARALGAAVRRLGIPVGRVLASPYCRTRETARLAFGRVRSSSALLQARDVRDGQGQPGRLRRLLARAPRAGTNTVLVSHGYAIEDATGVYLGEGEAAIVVPGHGRRGFERAARVGPTEWERLARDARPGPVRLRAYEVFDGAGPHDVAPARDGKVWFTAQGAGELGRLDPDTGRVKRVPLGDGSAPHGVIVGPDGAAWVTDGGLNAIVRVDARSLRVRRHPLPADRPSTNLNTATFDRNGLLWFTGQAGVYGRLDPRTGRMRVFDAPGGPGPYGIATTAAGEVWYASLAGSHVARVDTRSGRARVVEPPTAGQGARRIWPDSRGRLWVSEWNAGRLAMYDPRRGRWREWRLPGSDPMPYAVYVDDRDLVWVSDFGANALVRFDPERERFRSFPLQRAGASVRQLLGRPGEVWGAESATDRLVVARWR